MIRGKRRKGLRLLHHLQRMLWPMARKIEDAKQPFAFTVIQDDIDGAVQCDAQQCVFSRAIQRSQPWVVGVATKASAIYLLSRDGIVLRYRASASLMKTIQHYDLTGEWTLVGVVFTVRPAKRSERLGAKPRTQNAGTGKANRTPREFTVRRKFGAVAEAIAA